MKNLLTDAFDWLFMQSGFSWREWRSLSKSARNSPMPDSWTGDW